MIKHSALLLPLLLLLWPAAAQKKMTAAQDKRHEFRAPFAEPGPAVLYLKRVS